MSQTRIVKNDTNVVVLSGNVGGDARFFNKNDHPVARLSLCVNKTIYRDGQSPVAAPTWAQCVAFGGLANLLRDWGTKGRKFNVIGRLNDNKKRVDQEVVIEEDTTIKLPDGSTVKLPAGTRVTGKCDRTFQEIILSEVQFMDKKPVPQHDDDYDTGTEDEDIPF